MNRTQWARQRGKQAALALMIEAMLNSGKSVVVVTLVDGKVVYDRRGVASEMIDITPDKSLRIEAK